MEAGLKIRQHIICEELGPRQGFAVTIQFEFLVGADETLGRTATAAQDATVNAGGRLFSYHHPEWSPGWVSFTFRAESASQVLRGGERAVNRGKVKEGRACIHSRCRPAN